MTYRVRLFARAKDLAGADTVIVTLSAGATVADLRCQLAREYPALAALLSRCAIAIEGEFADDTFPLAADAEAAILPPVSGG